MTNYCKKFWTVESTGWSGGISWFECGSSVYKRLTFKTEQQALDYFDITKKKLKDPSIKWRIVYNENSKTWKEV
jgi:hypothetical protein